jgi:hypothetical protein
VVFSLYFVIVQVVVLCAMLLRMLLHPLVLYSSCRLVAPPSIISVD